MAEASAAIIIAQTVGIAVGTVAAIGIIAYGIYKVNKYLKHSHKEKSVKNDERKLAKHTDYEDIRPVKQNIKLRRRNVYTNLDPEKNQNTNVETEPLNNQSFIRCDQETQVEPNNNLSVTKCHQETQATPLNNLSVAKSHQETQTDEVFPTPVDLSGLNIVAGNPIADDDEANSVTSNGAESVYSFDSTSSGSSTSCNIPKWSEMSDEEKCLCRCTPCGRIVTTVTYPCKHPYFCSECAPVLFKFYHRCPKCRHRIKSFDYV